MKAMVYDRYGGAEFRAAEIPDVEPGRGQVLVRVRAASVNPLDCKIRRGEMKVLTGGRFPKTIGTDFAGEVVRAGTGVTGFEPAAAVFGQVNPVKRSNPKPSAELVLADARTLSCKPPELSFAEAACIPVAGGTALHALRNMARVRTGERTFPFEQLTQAHEALDRGTRGKIVVER